MHALHHRALNAYGKVALDAGLAAASPHRLIVMLFEGAKAALAQARAHLQAGDVAAKGMQISRAIAIIEEGLKPAVDLDRGGEIARNLLALYDYLPPRLLHANLHNDLAALDEVTNLLTGVADAWSAIGAAPTPAAA